MTENEREESEWRRHLGFEIHLINNLLDARRSEQMQTGDGEIPPTKMQTWIIRFLVHHPGGEIYQRDIESALHTSRATVSSTLKAMEKAGYIVRSSVEDDARLKKVTCTQKAVEAEKAAWRRIFENEAIMRRGMSDEDYETLLRLLEVVRVNLESERGRTAQEGAGSRIPDPAGKESDPT